MIFTIPFLHLQSKKNLCKNSGFGDNWGGMESVESNLLNNPKGKVGEGITVRSARFLRNVINPWPFFIGKQNE
jgi:hypothetical protein